MRRRRRGAALAASIANANGDWKRHLYTSSDDDLKYAFDIGADFGIAAF